jgi:hypothetical protein
LQKENLLPEGKIVTVLIGKPAMFLDPDDYCCPYHISGISSESFQYVGGVDVVQAIYLALKKI